MITDNLVLQIQYSRSYCLFVVLHGETEAEMLNTPTLKVNMDTPGTVDQCPLLQCETAALRWLGPHYQQPAAGFDEAETKRYY